MAELTTVQVFGDVSEAEIARSLLEHHGIFAFLPDKGVASTAWFLTNAVGGVRLQVPGSDLDDARQLLGIRDDFLAEGSVENCPQCGSGDVFRRSSLIAGLAGLVMVSIPILLRRSGRYCRQCRHKWRAEPK